MDFFSSLNQLRKNTGQLNAWEQQQRDKDMQRKAYQDLHAPTQDELVKAQDLGDTIMTAIDVMDDHSESIAENVETAIDPLSQILLLAGGALGFIGARKFLIKPANKKLDALEKAFDEDTKNIEFTKKLTDSTKRTLSDGTYQYKRFYTSDLRSHNPKELKNLNNETLKQEALKINEAWKKSIKKLRWKRNGGILAIPVVAALSWIMGNIWETKIQVDSSRIARFQARRELNDPKAFVNYTPEQIAEAKANLEKRSKKEKKEYKDNLKKGFFSSLRELLKDRSNYKETTTLRETKQRMIERPLTEAEILQAKKDKEVIQRVVKILNNESEKHSQKMEVAADVIFATFPVVTTAVTYLLTLGLEKTGLIKKWVGNYVNRNGSEEAKATFEALTKLNRKDPNYKSAWKEFFGEFTDMPMTKKQYQKRWKSELSKYRIEAPETHSNAKKASRVDKQAEFFTKAKKYFVGIMAHKRAGHWLIALASGLLASFPTSLLTVKMTKEASRAGRFTAKRELEKDPANFIGYSEEELSEVKDVKNTKKQESKFKEYALFIPRVLKDWFAYTKYKKNELQDKKALSAELRKLNVSDEQLRDAKNLQRKAFNTFEIIDDKSQIYSETTEAVIQSAQPFVIAGSFLALLSPLIVFSIKAAKGKFTGGKGTVKVTNVFAKFSNLLNTKLFKGYLKGVKKHTAKVVADTDTLNTHLSATLEGVDILKTPIGAMIPKMFINARNHLSKSFREMDLYDQDSKIYDYIRKLRKFSNVETQGNMSNLLYDFKNIQDVNLRANIIDILTLNKNNVAKMTNAQFNAAKDKIFEILQQNRVSVKDLATFISEFSSNAMKGVSSSDALSSVFSSQKGFSDILNDVLNNKELNESIQSVFNNMSKDNYVTGVSNIDKTVNALINEKTISLKCEDIPKIIKDTQKIVEGAVTNARMVSSATGGKSNKILNIFGKFENITDPKKAFNSMTKAIQDMDDITYQEFILKTPFHKWEKESTIKILNNLAKMWDNVPKEQIKNIGTEMIKQFNANPDKFVEAVKSGKIMKIFATPEIKRALAVAGVSWTAFTAVMTYIISSWLGDIQLRAGRLGVKKAMDELEDYRYYANVIPTNEQPIVASQSTSTNSNSRNNFLDKFKQNY